LGPALRVAGTVQDVGAGWVSLAGEGGRLRAVTPLAAIALMEGLPSRARPMGDAVLSPLGLGSILREIARDRSVVRVETAAGGVIGRIAAVGADTLDVRTLPTGEPTPVPGSARTTVSTPALLAVLLAGARAAGAVEPACAQRFPAAFARSWRRSSSRMLAVAS